MGNNRSVMTIGLFGPSGTGKSKIADWISKNYNIENVDLSAKHLLWEELGITSHKDVIEKSSLDPEWGTTFQGNLSAMRLMELDKRFHSYVTDRTPLDNIVYFLLQSSIYCTNEDTENFIKNNIKGCLDYYTHLIAFPVISPTIPDGKRVINTRYQQVVDNIYLYALNNFLLPHLVKLNKPKIIILKEWDWNKRIKTIRQFISPFNLN